MVNNPPTPQGAPLVGRYAPSPTGHMHLGNARTALLAWLHSRALGARHLLRFEDLDTGRVRAFAYDSIRRDLQWLGLDWDAEYKQSERLEYYEDALARLPTYPCTCTRKEILAAIQDSAGAPHDGEAVYAGTCRPRQLAVEQATLPAFMPPTPQGRAPAWRWLIPDGQVRVTDELEGTELTQDLRREVGDMVLRRNDGVFAYHLAVVVDDALMKVTDVVRGADLWGATPRQVALQRALGYHTPRYWHVPLMHDYAGQRLAKRGGAPPLANWREQGSNARQMISELLRSLPYQGANELPPELSAIEALAWWRDLLAVGHTD